MPVYTAKAINLLASGPILDIQVQASRTALAAMKKTGEKLPAAITVSAMIETGSSCSVIQSGPPTQLGLHPIGMQKVNTPTSQNVLCARFSTEMIFPVTAGLKNPMLFDLIMVEAPLSGQNIQCLLGRDFLRHGILIYCGPDQTFTFSC